MIKPNNGRMLPHDCTHSDPWVCARAYMATRSGRTTDMRVVLCGHTSSRIGKEQQQQAGSTRMLS